MFRQKKVFYLYDYDNKFIIRYVASFAILFLHERYCGGHAGNAPLTLIAALLGLSTLVYRHSIASMAAMIFIIVAYCMIDLLPKKLTSIRTIWVGFIVTSLVLALEVTFALSTDLISSVGKTISFLKRTSMWTIALNKLPENFLFGIGLILHT